jgi:hypothetical protein
VKLKAVQILSKAIIKMSIRKERQARSSELKMTDFFSPVWEVFMKKERKPDETQILKFILNGKRFNLQINF